MSDHQAVLDLAHKYLHSIYEGNPLALREVFHPNARVEDSVTGAFRSRSADEYILAVATRESPLEAGEPFTMTPLAIDVVGNLATVTAELHFFGNHFHNVLSLLRCDDCWRITHNLFGTLN
jgi:hypothetical protein